jgi:hypothetical protein
MTTSQKPSQNGTSTKPVETATNGKKVETTVLVAPLPVKQEPAKEEKIPSLEDKFYKLDVLQAHREKWQELKECQDKLNKFNLTYTGRTDNVTFKDSNGISFSTHNPEVVAKTIAWLKEDTAKRLAEVETLISFE